MHYQGRSPLKDVARSVVMGAAMVSPTLLQACSSGQTTSGTTPEGNGTTSDASSSDATTGGVTDAPTGSTTAATATAAPTESAPPDETVRPRGPTGGSMPTRGFQGAVRARR